MLENSPVSTAEDIGCRQALRFHAVCAGNVQTWLNGEEMVNIRDEKIGAGQGRIALQIHDGGGIKVLWRNLHLQTL